MRSLRMVQSPRSFENYEGSLRWIGKISTLCSITLPLLLTAVPSEPALADKRLNAPTAVGTRVNSDPESLLRYGLPIRSKPLHDLQENIESIKADLKLRRSPFVQSDLSKVRSVLQKEGDKNPLLSEFPQTRRTQASSILNRMKGQLKSLEEVIATETSSGTGSVQERESLDQALILQENLAGSLSQLEELAVPENFQRFIPSEYLSLPRLNQRATVEMKIIREGDEGGADSTKPNANKFDVFGKLYDEVDLKMVIDGYNAPITGGNFVDLVNRGFYNGMKISRSDGFVVQTGDKAYPSGKGPHGFIPPGESEERTIPLEIALKGDENLLYGSTSEEEGRGASATVLPFQAYGALRMARSEYEADSASSQFFWLLFESDLTPAGKNLLDGRYACFGYTVEGAELLKALKEGDVIKEAKVIEGLDNLIVPTNKVQLVTSS